MVVAASEHAMSHLAKQFFDRTTRREYVAIVWGNVKEDEGTITGHIGRSLRDRLQMAVFEDGSEGKHAVTHYKVLQRFGYVTVVLPFPLSSPLNFLVAFRNSSESFALNIASCFGKKFCEFLQILTPPYPLCVISPKNKSTVK